MTTKLIELNEGILVEVTTSPDEMQQISGGGAFDKVGGTIDQIKPVLLKVCQSVAAAWKDVSKDLHVEQAEIELGLGFEAEGNLFVAKGKADANLTVKLILSRKN